MKDVIFCFVIVAICIFTIWAVETRAPIRINPTDNNKAGISSRLVILTDHGTGCQYLSDGRGLTPRLDAQGKPMCGVTK